MKRGAGRGGKGMIYKALKRMKEAVLVKLEDWYGGIAEGKM